MLESFNRKICVLYFFFVMCVYDGEDWKKRMLVSKGKVEGETFYARARALIHQVHIYILLDGDDIPVSNCTSPPVCISLQNFNYLH